jgi:hypothetical protein
MFYLGLIHRLSGGRTAPPPERTRLDGHPLACGPEVVDQLLTLLGGGGPKPGPRPHVPNAPQPRPRPEGPEAPGPK